MDAKVTAAHAFLAVLSPSADGEPKVRLAQLAEALGAPLEALERAAGVAYPLSRDDEAAQCLLRDFRRTMADRSASIGFEAAFDEITRAALRSSADPLLKLLAGT